MIGLLTNDELRERIRQLEEMLAPSQFAFPHGWGLRATEARVLACLAVSPDGRRTDEQLLHAGWRWDRDGRIESLRVVISNLRKKLRGKVEIETLPCLGYRLKSESLVYLRSISNSR